MLENTNTKQYYPGPILNNTLEITSFLFRDPEQIKVQKTTLDEEGNSYNIDLNYGTDYEVIKILPNDINVEEANLTASTGQVILKSTITVGQDEKLTVYRESELVQETDYPRTGKFPAASHEGALDYLTMQNQEQQDQIDRALKVPISVASFQSEIPIPEANKALKINSTATGFEFSDYDPDQAFEQTQAYMQAAEAAADAAEASEIAAANSETAAAGSASAAASSASAAAASAQLAEDTVTAGVNTLQSTTSVGVDTINNATASGVSTINTLIEEAEQATDNAEIWAEGTDEEVQNLGGIHSAKTWAELSDTSTQLNRTQLSNCILSLTEGSITPQSYTDVSFVNHGTTDTSGVLSNFSASNFAILAKTMSNATAWTFTLPFTTGADVSGRQTIAAINNKDNCVIIDNGAIALVYNGAELKGDVGLSANTAYILEFIRTTTGYTVNVKQNETVIDTISVLSTSGFFGGKTVFLGNDQSGNYFKGSIGLATSSIYEGSTKYWKYSDDIDCQTVEVKGNFQLLMPNGRADNGTMTNVTKTISLDSLILYSPNGMGKTVLVTEDNELMARDSYVESYTQPENPALNSIWYDKTDNKLKQQLNAFPNYSVVGSPTISNGVISNFASGSVQINQSFDLGSADTWEITIPVTTPSAAPEDYENIFYDYNNDENENENLYVIRVSSGAYQFRTRRPDVYIVNNEVTVSTAYGVQTGTPEGEDYQSGYVQVSGAAESYVTTGTQIYSDPTFETPLTTAPENTWTYTGQNVNNTQLVTGYVKEAGVTLVPAQTTVYSDSNCTTVQATASGTDYTYSGGTAISYICILTQSATLSTAQTIKVGFNGSQYYISVDENQQTYNSTDKVNGISSGYHISSPADPFSGSINLNGLTVSLNGDVEWEWNGVSSTTTDFVSFVGAKIGKIEDGGTDITSATLDVPLTIAKDIDVVHNTGDETINGIKTFNEAIYVDKRNSSTTKVTAILRGKSRELASTPTSFSGCSIQSYSSSYDMTDESAANQSKAFGPQLLPLDKNGKYWGYFQFTNSYYNGGGQSVSSVWKVRRYIDGVIKSAHVSLGVSPNTSWFSFPKCNARPTTKSSAGTTNVDVIVKNYYSDTKGYVQFGSGLKIQWARTSVSASNDRETITWGLPFSNTNYACVLGPGNSGPWTSSGLWRYAKSTTSVSVGKMNSSNAQCYTDVVAIGY